MRAVPVELGARSYDVHIGDGLLDRAGEQLMAFARDGRLIVITDATVWDAAGPRLVHGLGDIAAEPVVVAPGEGSKSWATLAQVIDRLLELGIERRDHIVAFGGGVVGDLAGFAAAIVNRGCGLVQVPTTLLAQVDSSVGGKTGINVSASKNLVGAFHQPALVLIDPTVLGTLDSRQVRAGYAEIVKYALIEDAGFFAWLEAHGAAVIAGDPEARRHAIATSVAGKARIVAADERESGGRRILLNHGHSFAHALEAQAGFGDVLLHGEAVAVGMVLAFELSVQRGYCAPADAARVAAHLRAVGLPTTLKGAGLTTSGEQLVGLMAFDKKRENGTLPFILTRGIGEAFVDRDVDLGQVAALLDRLTAADRRG